MEIIDLEMIPGGPKKTCHASQFDNGRAIRFNLKENGQPFALSGTETVQAIIRKPDGSETTLDIANTSSTYVDLITEADTCDLAGVNHCEMKVTEDGEDLGSGNFDMKVEKDPYGEAGVTVGTASGPIASFETDINDDLIECKGDISYRAEGYKQATFINSRSMPQKDTEPYLFRPSGGSLQNIGGQEHDTLVGGTLAFNQLVETQTIARQGLTAQIDTDGVISVSGVSTSGYSNITKDANIQDNHKYYTAITVISNPNNISLYWSPLNANLTPQSTSAISSGSTSRIFTVNSHTGINTGIAGFNANTDFTGFKIKLLCIDLTQMFGSTIADYIYGLEQATAGAGVAFFKKLFPKDYYPYNAGELISVKTSKHITRGFNAWDEKWELGSIDNNTGENTASTSDIRCKNFIPIFPNTPYCFTNLAADKNLRAYWYDANKNFISSTYLTTNNYKVETTPVNAYYCKIRPTNNYGTTYNNDICVNISGTRDGEYKPYEEHAYPLDDIELRGIPKLINNRLVFDGDEYADNGAVERRYGVVDLGSLNWNIYNNRMYCSIPDMNKSRALFISSSGYTPSDNGTFSVPDGCITTQINDNFVIIYDSNFTDPALFKTNLSGKYFVYEKATPSEETAEPFTNPQAVSKYGTEEYIDGRTVEMPVGHLTIYGDDIQAKTATFPERIYGGEINMTTGELTSTKNADGTDKATPDTYQLTPKNLEARSGQNNIMNDTNGDTAVKFYTRA